MNHDIKDRITLRENPNRVRIFSNGTLIADTTAAIELHEIGYPVRQYIPREDIALSCLKRSETVTHCPFKGEARYYSIELHGKTTKDAAWSYEAPFDSVAEIKGRLAFDDQRVEIRIEPASATRS